MASGHLTSLTRILLPAVVFFLAVACRNQARKTGLTTKTLYAEYKGNKTTGSISSTIHRKLFLTDWGESRLVISEISRITDMGSFRMSSSRKLTELRINDTLFYFDTADSTFWRVSLEEAKKLSEKELPLSALWLIRDWNTDTGPGNIYSEELIKIVTDTLLPDELFRLPEGYRLLRPSADISH